MPLPDWEPLLPDSRIEKIASLIRIMHPDLREAEFFSFVVPDQVVQNRRAMRHAPHDEDCAYAYGNSTYDCSCGPLEIPPQAVFGLRSSHPKQDDPVYRGKRVITTESTWLKTWRAEEKERAHFVSTSEDPAFSIFRIAGKAHAEKIVGYRQLI